MHGKRILGSILALIVSWAFCEAQACPEMLQNIKSTHLPAGTTICSLHDRYHAALDRLEKQGVSPAERIAALHAPRMINPPDWIRQREAKNYNPWLIYEPVPQTWQSWENGARVLETLESENQNRQSIQPLSFDVLTKVHSTALRGLVSSAGKFRQGNEVGKSLAKNSAITAAQSQGLLKSEYPSLLNPGAHMMSWHATQCYEDRTPEFRQKFEDDYNRTHQVDLSQWPDQNPNVYFKAEDGSQKQCGYVVYADPREVPAQMEKWLQYINTTAEQLNSKKIFAADPVLAAARIQRWFITIHPFEDGNGRMSRFMMEYVLRSLGLPTPILNDFNNDIYFTEIQWADEIGQGLIKAVQTAEACGAQPAAKGCQVVSENP